MRPTTPARLVTCALLALAPFLTACDGDSAKQAASDAKAAAAEVADATREHAQAAGEAAKAAGAAAKETLGEAGEDLAAARDAAGEKLGQAVESLKRFSVESKDELVAKVEAELVELDAKTAELKAAAADASEGARMQLSLVLAKLDTKRVAFEAKLDGLRAAGADKWADLQEGVEERLAGLEDEVDQAEERVDALLEEDTGAKGDTTWSPGVPKELFEVVKVVDGDTIHIARNGGVDKLRLLSVDTEEKLSGRPFNPDKPETLYGEDTMLWAQDLFAGLAGEDGVTRVGVAFPNGEEEYDMYGRLLCHVILPDGTDFNVQLVAEGRSPYFMKYGYSRLAHGAFEAAEAEARKAELGVWSPDVNKPASASDPWHKRDYDKLVPWWRARAEAIEAFRTLQANNPQAAFASEDEDGLAEGVEYSERFGYPINVFGAIDRVFEEDDGSLTLLFRALEGKTAFRAHIPAELRSEFAHFDFETRGEPYKQNYFFVVGDLVRGPRGFDIWATDKFSIRLGAPDPVYPE